MDKQSNPERISGKTIDRARFAIRDFAGQRAQGYLESMDKQGTPKRISSKTIDRARMNSDRATETLTFIRTQYTVDQQASAHDFVARLEAEIALYRALAGG